VADVLIIDEQGVYLPRDPNDRLLLGLKGQMSEAEKYWIVLRMQGAKMSRARRGELRLVPPTGYQWDEAARRLCLDPDEQVQRAVRLVFERFRIDGGALAALRYFTTHGIKLPARHLTTNEVRWVPPRPCSVLGMLHNPIYAGAYVYGRRECRTRLVDGKIRRSALVRLPQDQWKVLIRDRHPAYITWEEFLSNRRKLAENRATQEPTEKGAPREGNALLQGLILCGKCGYRMSVHYAGPSHCKSGNRYFCRSNLLHGKPDRQCWSVPAARVDQAVVERFLELAQPPEIELAFAVTREAERQAVEIDRQWKLTLERARYEARLAERRYKAVDPDNRIVARTLERNWEEKLRALQEAELGYEQARQRRKVDLSEQDRRKVLALAKDLRRVWEAPTTTCSQRKNLLRLLIQTVTLSPIDVPRRMTRIQILWDGDAVDEIRIDRPEHVSPNRVSDRALALIKNLFNAGKRDKAIVEELNHAGLRTGSERSWSRSAVAAVRRRNGLYRYSSRGKRAKPSPAK
jgi:hypothetical protein